ncbi:probable disease resistance protein At5g63020 [Rosa rugosa]|uniref:probable disease resistance protein At5g63020 n=1 Tax=Rosa rugosa TaxID=74645 RepID=UPI002B4032D9|nr:probable disease resistance protein At5g63020 [Rosa rugosa]
MDSIIRSALRGKKFVLLLDDVWRPIDLKKVGVPDPHITNSKVIFTTSVEGVCTQMGGKKHKVMCLPWEDAWSLFKQNVNKVEDILSLYPDIPGLAESVAKECAGLPLALIIVGSDMSCRKTAGDWRKSHRDLRTSAAKFEDMEQKVFHLLTFSYDNLASKQSKSCFLYCALYPEDFSIHRNELIYKWMGHSM